MNPIGETYLVKCYVEHETNEGGIITLNDVDINKDVFWKGVIVGYGTKMNVEDPDIVPIGSTVVIDFNKKNAVKLIMKGTVLYSIQKEDIIAILED